MTTLILTEKPSVAHDIAEAIGKFKKCDGYNIAGDYIITYAFGHLLKQDEKDIPKEWTLETLPIFPEKFIYKPVNEKIKQFNIIADLLTKTNKLVIATDAGREGELIARLILHNAGWKNWENTYRLWTSEALTPFVVKRELENLRLAKDFESLYYSALARQHSDYVTGINLTRMISIKAKSTWSVGRVQTPTLKLIVDRDLERLNFRPQEYYTIKGNFEKDSITFSGKLIKNLNEKDEEKFKLSKEESKKISDDLNNKGYTSGIVTKAEVEQKKTPPPLLHSLTSLQREANKTLGFSALQTLDIAQTLYEKHKCISYPRTDSNHLADTPDMKQFVSDKLERLNMIDKVGDIESAGKRVFDSSKLTDHHALIPLLPYLGDDKKEEQIYSLIYRKFVGAFMKEYIFQATTAIIAIVNYNFFVSGKKDLSLGWKILYKDEEEEKQELLPILNQNDQVKVLGTKEEQKFTKPQDAINEGSLLGMMEKLNLGTPATRASIIETLLNRQYVIREKKNLISEEKGRELIILLKNSEIVSPEMTALWENKLDDIYKDKKGFNGYQDFYSEIKDFVTAQLKNISAVEIKEIKQVSPKQRELAKELMKGGKEKIDLKDEKQVNQFISDSLKKNQEGMPCLCGNGRVTKTPLLYKCSCDKAKIVWSTFSGKNITWEEALKLLNGDIVLLKGLTGKNGKYETLAKLEEKGKIKFVNKS